MSIDLAEILRALAGYLAAAALACVLIARVWVSRGRGGRR